MKKDKTLTTRFDLQTMAEFAVSAEILGARSINALVHQLVVGKIREAKRLVSEDEFAAMVEQQKKESLVRSEMKSKERLEILGVMSGASKLERPLLEIGELEAEKPKRAKKKKAA
jgi:hypothetical protein